MTPEQIADAILRAAGSRLAHYEPKSQERIIEAARAAISELSVADLQEAGAKKLRDRSAELDAQNERLRKALDDLGGQP